MNAVIYTRCAVEDSLDMQEKACRQYAELQGYQVVKTYSDNGVSGLTSNRVGLQNLLQEIDKGSTVIAYDDTRLARSVEEMHQLYKIFVQKDVDVHLVKAGCFPKSPTDKLAFYLTDLVRSFDNNIRSERIKRGLRAKKNKGLTN